LDVDHGFRGLVRVWERRFGELHLMVEPVEPDAKIWQRIKGKVNSAAAPAVPAAAAPSPPAAAARKETVSAAAAALSPPAAAARKETVPAAAAAPPPPVPPTEPAAQTKPDPIATAEQKLADLINEVGRFEKKPAAAEPAAAEPAEEVTVDIEDEPVAADAAREPAPPVLLAPTDRAPRIVRQRAPRGGRWRAMALLMPLLASGLGGMTAAWRYAPERLPQQLQPQVVLNLSGAPTARTPAPHGTQFEE